MRLDPKDHVAAMRLDPKVHETLGSPAAVADPEEEAEAALDTAADRKEKLE